MSTDVSATEEIAWHTHRFAAGDDPFLLLRPEWLLANGTGGFSLSTALGANTRRYHGLLVAATNPPVGRIVVLNQMLEQLWLDDASSARPIEFNTSVFRGREGGEVYVPDGHQWLRFVDRGLSMRWVYETNGLTFSRELFLHWKQQAITLRYTIDGLDTIGRPVRLRLSPMVSLRDFHSLQFSSTAGAFSISDPRVQPGARARGGDGNGAVFCVSRDGNEATFTCDHGCFDESPNWWYQIFYPIETERGQDDMEDIFVPGGFDIELPPAPSHVIHVTAALGAEAVAPCVETVSREQHLSSRVISTAETFDAKQPVWQAIDADEEQVAHLQDALVIASDDFVVDRTIKGEKLSTILAGYPWFADWGRDTFIALPGLLLSTGRFEEARATLRAFAGALGNGLVPNRFDDYDDEAAHYNTVDASLWFVNAALQYLDATEDEAAWRDWLAEACVSVIDAYLKGTDYDIHMTGDGLVSAGSPTTQLTWMDAACNGQVFTPRPGKAVEINALWYNALAGLAERFKETDPAVASHYEKLCKRISRAFMKVFWDDEQGYCNDHVWTDEAGADHVDHSLRPNQIFAAALPRSPLPRTKQALVVDAVREALLTPYGLRTLPETDGKYHAHYCGPQPQRDEAYHQGTIWPWLIGPYAEAVLRTGKFGEASKREALQTIEPLLEMMLGRTEFPTLGQLYEIHEAALPHRPVGCMAQAWSVAEVLRVLTLIAKG